MSLMMHTFFLIFPDCPPWPLMNNAAVRSLCLHTARPLSIPTASSPSHTLVLFFSSASPCWTITWNSNFSFLTFITGRGFRISCLWILIALFFIFFVKEYFYLIIIFIQKQPCWRLLLTYHSCMLVIGAQEQCHLHSLPAKISFALKTLSLTPRKRHSLPPRGAWG